MSRTVHVKPGDIIVVDKPKPKAKKTKGKVVHHKDGTMTLVAPGAKKKKAVAPRTKGTIVFSSDGTSTVIPGKKKKTKTAGKTPAAPKKRKTAAQLEQARVSKIVNAVLSTK